MPSHRTQSRIMELSELQKAATHDKHAQAALDRYNKLVEQGKRPEIRWSKFNGWSASDPTDDWLRKLEVQRRQGEQDG